MTIGRLLLREKRRISFLLGQPSDTHVSGMTAATLVECVYGWMDAQVAVELDSSSKHLHVYYRSR